MEYLDGNGRFCIIRFRRTMISEARKPRRTEHKKPCLISNAVLLLKLPFGLWTLPRPRSSRSLFHSPLYYFRGRGSTSNFFLLFDEACLRAHQPLADG